MKREELNRIFEGASKEQIDQVMALNGADITREQQRVRAELEDATARLTRAGETIRALEESAGDAERLRSEIEAYRRHHHHRANALQPYPRLQRLLQQV